jgi:hypothetical protein
LAQVFRLDLDGQIGADAQRGEKRQRQQRRNQDADQLGSD